MKIKKLLSTMLTVVMVAGLSLSGFDSNTVKAAENTETSIIPEMDHLMDNNISFKKSSAAQNDTFSNIELNNSRRTTFSDSGHSTANTALYLDSSYMENVLADTALDSENWYYFNISETNKISVILEQPSSGGDYDIYLYKYSEDGTLTLISYSIYSGSMTENLSAVAESGYYFLRVIPETAATTEEANYNFMISLIGAFDACEPDDNPAFAVEYTNSINVNNTIDNVYDQDWSKLTVSDEGIYIVSMSNIPSGNTYNVYVYDSSLNLIGGLSCSENKAGTVSLSAGTYYISIASASGYSDTESYNLKIMKRTSSSSVISFTKTGQIVELTSSALYVNGKKVDMNWSYHYTINYTRNQDVKTSSSTSFRTDYLKNGTYSGPQSVTSSDCIAVYMDNFVYTYFCRDRGAGADYDYVYQPFEDGQYVLFYVDAVTGTVIDTEINYYYLTLGMKQTFTEFN